VRAKERWCCLQADCEWRKLSLRYGADPTPLVLTSSPLHGDRFLGRNGKVHILLAVSSSLGSQHGEATVGLDSARMGIERALWRHRLLSSGDHEDFILFFLFLHLKPL